MRIWIALVGLVATTAAQAQPAPAALVEDVTGTEAGVEFMDYVPTGKIIRLGIADSLVLSYLKSCVRETIAGGTVTVGAERSQVAGGAVQRDTVKCDKGAMNLAANQAQKSGVMVMRAPPRPSESGAAGANQLPTPELTLYGLSPVVDLRGGGTLLIERLDKPGERHEVQIPPAQMLRGAYVDFAKAGKALTAGGLYRAAAASQVIVFKVDPFAQGGQAPIVGRLLRFPRPS